MVGGVPAKVLVSVEEYLQRIRNDSLPVSAEERKRIERGEDQTRVMRAKLLQVFDWDRRDAERRDS